MNQTETIGPVNIGNPGEFTIKQVRIYIYLHSIHTNIHTHTYIYIYICVCIYIYIYIYMDVRTIQHQKPGRVHHQAGQHVFCIEQYFNIYIF